MISQTSILAFQDSVGKRVSQSMVILRLLRVSPTALTNRELERVTGFSISSVTARVNELVRAGVVRAVSCRRCTVTGCVVHEWIHVNNMFLARDSGGI